MNAFILFENFRKKHRYVQELQRPNRYGQLDFTEELIRQLADLDVHADVPLASKKCVFTTHPNIPAIRKEKIAKNVTKRNKKNKKLVSNVWAVKLTCVFRKIETVSSVFTSVSVIVCVALHFQWLPYLNIMKSVCDSKECEKNANVITTM